MYRPIERVKLPNSPRKQQSPVLQKGGRRHTVGQQQAAEQTRRRHVRDSPHPPPAPAPAGPKDGTPEGPPGLGRADKPRLVAAFPPFFLFCFYFFCFVLQVVRIRREAFPMRVTFKQFYRRFGNLLLDSKDMPTADDMTSAEVIPVQRYQVYCC